MKYVTDRKGHDRRYGIDPEKSNAIWAGIRKRRLKSALSKPLSGISLIRNGSKTSPAGRTRIITRKCTQADNAVKYEEESQWVRFSGCLFLFDRLYIIIQMIIKEGGGALWGNFSLLKP